MQDVEIPRVATYSMSTSPSHSLGAPSALANPDPRLESYSLSASAASPEPSANPIKPEPLQRVYYVPPTAPATQNATDPPKFSSPAEISSGLSTASPGAARQLTLFALKSETIYPATDYWVDGSLIFFVLPDGTARSTDLDYVDWQRTTDLNAERNVRVSLRTRSSQF
jgi:hypothetical protein